MWTPRLILILAALFFVASLILPVGVWFDAPDPGYQYLLFGWMGLLAGVVCWLANPVALAAISLLATKKYNSAFRASVIAALLAGSTLLYWFFQFHINFDAGGTFKTPGIGYYFWLISLVLLSIGTFIHARKSIRP